MNEGGRRLGRDGRLGIVQAQHICKAAIMRWLKHADSWIGPKARDKAAIGVRKGAEFTSVGVN